jgi:hypothetical protein
LGVWLFGAGLGFEFLLLLLLLLLKPGGLMSIDMKDIRLIVEEVGLLLEVAAVSASVVVGV